MHDLVVISKIRDVRSIEGKDRIVVANVANYNSIIAKEEFKEGDLCVYCTYDTCLPVRPEFEFLRKRCYNAKLDMFRIRPMKMGGIISEGLVLPMSILPEGSYKEGQVITDIIGAKDYEDLTSNEVITKVRKPKWWMKYKILRTLFGRFNKKKSYTYPCPKSDEDNIEKMWDSVKDLTNTQFYLTEKMEGCSSTYVLDKRKKVMCFSHNFYNDSGCWLEVSKLYDMKDKLLKINKKFRSNIAIQGEICGPGIQKNIYDFKSYKFFLFGAYDTKTGRRLRVTELNTICDIAGLEMVPSIEVRTGVLPSLEEMLSNCEGMSSVNPKVMREGVVWRTDKGEVHFKCKSRPYKVWFS